MQVTTRFKQSTLYIYLDGELDQSVADRLRAELDKCMGSSGVEKVVFNLRKLSFMDSTGIGLILGRYKKLRTKHIPLFFDEPSPQIDKVLKVSGLYDIIPVI
ncbi:MAG: anti-sigma factor antagonist [Clostridia bacterium]|nr:anti-sigma factor antagonist [Clostridia bacterium]